MLGAKHIETGAYRWKGSAKLKLRHHLKLAQKTIDSLSVSPALGLARRFQKVIGRLIRMKFDCPRSTCVKSFSRQFGAMLVSGITLLTVDHLDADISEVA